MLPLLEVPTPRQTDPLALLLSQSSSVVVVMLEFYPIKPPIFMRVCPLLCRKPGTQTRQFNDYRGHRRVAACLILCFHLGRVGMPQAIR